MSHFWFQACRLCVFKYHFARLDNSYSISTFLFSPLRWLREEAALKPARGALTPPRDIKFGPRPVKGDLVAPGMPLHPVLYPAILYCTVYLYRCARL